MTGKTIRVMEYEIEQLERRMMDLEYEFVHAKSFGDRRDILEEYLSIQSDVQSLINTQL